jgi:hypothetical protein
MTRIVKLALALGVLLALEFFLFSRSFDLFFNGDSLYYFTRRLTSFSDLVRVFTHVDYLEEYRPLPFALFSFLFYPLFKLDPRGYHFIPILFHLANTALAFLLARRLLSSSVGAFVAAFFFGVHSGNFFITYDLAMMTEFTYVLFFLLAMLFSMSYLEEGGTGALVGALGAFALSLLAKEAAVTLVATAPLAATVLYGKERRDEGVVRSFLRACLRAWPLFAAAGLYLVLLLAIKDWHLFPKRPGHPHHAVFTLGTLLAKLRYLEWTFNIPAGLILKKAALPQLTIAAGLLPFAAAVLLWTAWGVLTAKRIVLCGLGWFLATLSPVLFLPNLTQPHYLYLPVVGVGLLFGSLADALFAPSRTGRPRLPALGAAAVTVFAAANVAACWHNTTGYLQDSWLPNASRIAKATLDDVKAARPSLPDGALLYFLRSNEKDLSWYYDNGGMFTVFYGNKSIRTEFADRGAEVPADALTSDRVLLLRYIRPHVYDATEEFRAEAREGPSLKLLPLFREQNIAFDKREGCYPGYEVFDTPSGKPAFRMSIGRGRIGREGLVLIAGARLRLEVDRVPPQGRLAFGITMPFDKGDGAEARMYFEHDGGRELLYSRWLDPTRVEGDRKWRDEAIELGHLAGKAGALVLECNSGPELDVIGDWVAWSRLRILESAGEAPTTPDPRTPTWLHVTPTSVRSGELVIVSVGNGGNLTIDCRYRLNGAERVEQRSFTANAAGQFTFQPEQAGRWEILEIKNATSDRWVRTPAVLVVQ